MNILVLGGTQFLGRHFVEVAKNKGHQLTLFNRGKTNPNLFSDIETVVGDRTCDLDKLNKQNFDAVIDTSGYYPKNIEYVASHLKDKVGQYVFISTCSVFDYNDQSQENFEEDGSLVNLDIDKSSDSPETYGARKYHCEEIIRKTFPNNHLVARPGLIVGPYDPTYRFPYWADRISEGGQVLCPGEPNAPLQFIDARDLADWLLHAMTMNINGTFNTASPHAQLTIGDFLNEVKNVVNSDCELKWVNEQTLKDNDVTCWNQLPLWVYKEVRGFLKVNSDKAISSGLKFRPLSKTIEDTHRWSQPLYKEHYLNKVLERDHEKRLLDSLKQ